MKRITFVALIAAILISTVRPVQAATPCGAPDFDELYAWLVELGVQGLSMTSLGVPVSDVTSAREIRFAMPQDADDVLASIFGLKKGNSLPFELKLKNVDVSLDPDVRDLRVSVSRDTYDPCPPHGGQANQGSNTEPPLQDPWQKWGPINFGLILAGLAGILGLTRRRGRPLAPRTA